MARSELPSVIRILSSDCVRANRVAANPGEWSHAARLHAAPRVLLLQHAPNLSAALRPQQPDSL